VVVGINLLFLFLFLIMKHKLEQDEAKLSITRGLFFHFLSPSLHNSSYMAPNGALTHGQR